MLLQSQNNFWKVLLFSWKSVILLHAYINIICKWKENWFTWKLSEKEVLAHTMSTQSLSNFLINNRFHFKESRLKKWYQKSFYLAHSRYMHKSKLLLVMLQMILSLLYEIQSFENYKCAFTSIVENTCILKNIFFVSWL